ncbi:15132_t:CDS:2, partial [Racocetra persica]
YVERIKGSNVTDNNIKEALSEYVINERDSILYFSQYSDIAIVVIDNVEKLHLVKNNSREGKKGTFCHLVKNRKKQQATKDFDFSISSIDKNVKTILVNDRKAILSNPLFAELNSDESASRTLKKNFMIGFIDLELLKNPNLSFTRSSDIYSLGM